MTPFTEHNIYFGDSRKLNKIADGSVQLIVTSPPYWQLNDHGAEDQAGYNDSYEEYINNLNLVWTECYRVLSGGCRICVNIGYQFARSAYYGRYKVIPIRDEIIRYCEALGLDYMGSVIWQKATASKSTNSATVMGSYLYPRNGIIRLDYEYILIFRKLGSPPEISDEIKEASKLTKEEWNKYFFGHWKFPGAKKESHPAPFPEELPKRLIKMYSFKNDVVFDPFLGSGTTSLAALKLERNSVGYELNKEYKDAVYEKINSGITIDCDGIVHLHDDDGSLDTGSLEKNLIYKFKDFVGIKRIAHE
jgi:site-specific DNA-methyltransferase (adenine-specific)